MPMGPVRIPSIRPHKMFSRLLTGKKMLFMGKGHEPSTAGQAGLLREEGEVLVAGEYLRQEELSQPMQRRVTPCSTIFARLTPGFLPLSSPTIIFFALKTKHIFSKMTTELPLLAGCELGCARSVPSGCLASYFWAVSVSSSRRVGRYCISPRSPSPPNVLQLFPFYFGSQPYAV